MTLYELAVVLAVGLAGPMLASPKRVRVPVVVGEIAVGVVHRRAAAGRGPGSCSR
ncbi:MAG TPA: hypothetical protein VH333_05690 [Pseudonocardiaceae bacterium]|nr:hypothetical protein [Pseudonocardiaceae bacterium]